MTDIRSRVIKLENSLLAKDRDGYRHLCFGYNLKMISDEDLLECLKAIYEGREMDPEVQRRVYRPIPPNAPTYLIDKARALMQSPVTREISVEELGKRIEEHEAMIRQGRQWQYETEASA